MKIILIPKPHGAPRWDAYVAYQLAKEKKA